MKKLTFTLIVFLITASLNLVFSQDKVISAKIIDKDSNEEIYLASIRLLRTNLANISNSDGYFSLRIPDRFYTDTDSIHISYLGYNSTTMSVVDLDKAGKIFLEPNVIPIDPVIILSIDPISLYENSIKNAIANSHKLPLAMTGFYREMVRRGNNTYLSLNESILDINKRPYSTKSTDQIGIYKGRGSINHTQEDTLLLKLEGGPTSSLELDIMKDPFVGVYPEDALSSYEFSLGSQIYINNKSFYTLNFIQKNPNSILYNGKMYVDPETYAVARIEFNLNITNQNAVNRFFVKQKSKDTNIDINGASYLINYRETEDGWVFDYSRIELKVDSRRKGRLFSKNFTVISELAITDFQEGRFGIERENIVRNRDIITDKVSSFTDDTFWEGYNIIEPDQSIQSIINRIIRQLKRRDRRS